MTEDGTGVSITVALLNELGDYSVDYVTPNPVEDQTVRTVRVVVSYPNHGITPTPTGQDTDQYTAPAGAPSITITVPPPEGDASSDSLYTIEWTDDDPNDNAMIQLEYASVGSPLNRTIISAFGPDGIWEDDPLDQHVWDVSEVSKGSYYIYGTIDDGYNPPPTGNRS